MLRFVAKNHDHKMNNYKKIALCIGGVPGSGKTTLLKAHAERHVHDLQVTGSDIVKKIIFPSSVHDLDSWDTERRQSVREKSINSLKELQEKSSGRLLVDGHFTLRNRTTGLLESIFTPEDKRFFKALVILHPSCPQVIISQRLRDKRSRSTESVEEVTEHIDYELYEGRRLANEMNVPLLELVQSDFSLRLEKLTVFLDQVAPRDR